MIHQTINSVGSHYNGTFYKNASWDYHFHDSFELIYVLCGEVTVTLNAETVHISTDEFFLISPAVVHSIDSSKDSHFFISIFTQDFTSEFSGKTLKLNFYHFTVDETIYRLFEKHMLYPESYNRYMIKSCAYALCASANDSPHNVSQSDTDREFIFEVNKYISENFKLDISRKSLASALNYEEHYFSSLFSKNMNMNLRKYINIHRFALSQKLLISTNMSITHIASECGFKSIRSFNNIFKSLSGLTPASYRKKYS